MLTRKSDKRSQLQQLGAKHVIVSDEQDVVAEVLRLTNGQGARVVFDPVGGPAVTQLAECTPRLGIIFQYGAAQFGADATSAVCGPQQIVDDPGLRPVRDHIRRQAARRGKIFS